MLGESMIVGLAGGEGFETPPSSASNPPMNAIAKKIDTGVTTKTAPTKALKTSSNVGLVDVVIMQIVPRTIVTKEKTTPPHPSQTTTSRRARPTASSRTIEPS
jgi:hypothetical protein